MTILTKPSIVIKKADGTNSPLVDVEKGGCDEVEDKVKVYPSAPAYRAAETSSGALFCMVVIAFLVAMSGITCGLMLYRQYLRTNTRRYQGFCTIPMDIREQMNLNRPDPLYPLDHEVIPLHWSNYPYDRFHPNNNMNQALREELDIEGQVEKIYVLEDGKTVSFIHDFEKNATGIIDDDRCFVMPLDPEVVLSPDYLLVGIQQDKKFDVSRLRSTLSAILPALTDLMRDAPMLVDDCQDKPTYSLQENGGNIRKRSVDEPPHDYIQFAGKHVQEIDIANLADLLAYERTGTGTGTGE